MLLINAFVMLVIGMTVELSYQRPSVSNKWLQGRHHRNIDDIPAEPLSEEEFRLSLYQEVEANAKDPTNEGVATEGLIEGDIAGFEFESIGDTTVHHNAINLKESLWNGGIVPYTIDVKFNKEERQIIARGMRNIQDKSCIQFIPRTTEKDYIKVMSGNGCFSSIGRKGGPQDLSLQRNRCVDVETAIHELMHALGFEHEHNRPDRDNFIRINEYNLQEGAFEKHFKKFDSTRFSSFTDYDMNSIMHYKPFVYAKNESVPTIRAKKATSKKPIPVGSITGLLSKIDQEKLNKLYKCDLSLAITMDCPVSYLGSNDNPCFKIQKYGCYCVVKEKKTRSEADQFCRDHQMQLVWFETKEENNEVAKLMIENDVSEFWTSGVNRELVGAAKWRWEQYISSASFPVKEFNWCPDDPDNFDGNEYYILARNIAIGENCWQDAPGQVRWPAVCKPPLSTKILSDNLQKLHSLLTVAFIEIEKLEKKNNAAFSEILALENTNNEVLNELKELKQSGQPKF